MKHYKRDRRIPEIDYFENQEKGENMTTIKSNFHTHTKRCKHANGSEEDYVKSALLNGLSQLGFSDHGPYPDIDPGMRMLFHELKDYLETLDALTIKYQKDISGPSGSLSAESLCLE